MGLLEKLKNTFFEEEYVEVEEKKKKEPKPIAKKVDVKPKKEENKVELSQVEEVVTEEVQEVLAAPEVFADKELLKTDHHISYFEDDDFVETPEPIKKEEKQKLYGVDPEKLYQSVSYANEESHKPYTNTSQKTGFKPTPIISPIYGILDRNYRKEEVVDKKDKPSSYVSRRYADLDSVRNKAFGSLADDIMLSNDVQSAKEEVITEPLVYDMMEGDDTPAVEKVTIADAEEYFEDLGLEYNVDYKDSRYEKATGRRSGKAVVNNQDSTHEPVIIEENEEPNLEDNLFDLVDSMYEDKE